MTTVKAQTDTALFAACMHYILTGGKEPDWAGCAKIWNRLFRIAYQQAVEALFYDVVQTCPSCFRPPKELCIRLYAHTLAIEEKNKYIDRVVHKIFTSYAEYRIRPVLIKGQALGTYYPRPDHRSPGDIDIFIPDNFERANRWVAEHGNNISSNAQEKKHIHFEWKGIPVENHFKLAVFHNHDLDRHLQHIVRQTWNAHRNQACTTTCIDHYPVETLPPTLALLHLLVHFAVHLTNWGVGLRQFHDIVLFMRSEKNQINRSVLNHWIATLKLGHITTAIAQAAINWYGLLEEDIPYSFIAGSTRGDRLLHLLFKWGNFGRNNDSSKETHFDHFGKNAILYLRQSLEVYTFFPQEIRSALFGKSMKTFKRLI